MTDSLDVLLFTRTTGFRHASLQPAVDALEALSRQEHWTITHSEDSTSFSHERLTRHHVVLLLNTTGNLWDAAQRAALEAFVGRGGGVVAVHAPAVIDFDWPWYERLIGTRFAGHPEPQRGIVVIEEADHPAMRDLPQRWEVNEEWYNFHENPRPRVKVLASVDERSYEGGKMGDHPIVWCHDDLGGRVLYTGLGHDSAAYSDPLFMSHLARAVGWAAQRPS
ncbi:MAG TPA: ThuA domain-containing protein [Polyangiaceae bacterium]|nr:ThuA domain-containing protein [Polyangiaceae bacterium]